MVNVNQETVKRSYTITLINLTLEFVKVVQNTKGQERKKKGVKAKLLELRVFFVFFCTRLLAISCNCL